MTHRICFSRTWLLRGWRVWNKIGECAYCQRGWYKIQFWW